MSVVFFDTVFFSDFNLHGLRVLKFNYGKGMFCSSNERCGWFIVAEILDSFPVLKGSHFLVLILAKQNS